MMYKFRDMDNEELYLDENSVLFIFGKHTNFNAAVIDTALNRIKERYSVDIQVGEEDYNMFGISESVETNGIERGYTRLGIDEYIEYVNSKCLNGKWYCKEMLETMTEKQKSKLMAYISDASDNGLLIIESTSYKNYRNLIGDKRIKNNKYVNSIELSFPKREDINKYIIRRFSNAGKNIGNEEASVISRAVGIEYESIDQYVNIISDRNTSDNISMNTVESVMKGVQNYVTFDMLDVVMKGVTNDKITAQRKGYRVIDSVFSMIGYKAATDTLITDIKRVYTIRKAINNGLIPVNVSYNVKAAQERIDNKLVSSISTWRFERYYNIAIRHSIKELANMLLVIESTEIWTELECVKLVYLLLNRNVVKIDVI